MNIYKKGKHKIREYFNSIYSRVKYNLDNIFQKKGILLIPPTILNGSFGDELMVVSFLEANTNIPVTIYSQKTVVRNDCFGNYKNVKYLSWKVRLNLNYYNQVIVLGADNLTGSYGEKNPIFKFDLLNRANKKGVKTAVLGFSLKSDLSSVLKNKMVTLVPFTKFKLRDIDSYEIAKTFLPIKNLELVGDLAFLCPYEKNVNERYLSWISKQKLAGKQIVAVCPNAIQANNIGKDNYCNLLIKNLLESNSEEKLCFVMLYHDIRPHCDGLSDKDLSKHIYDKLRNNSNVYFEANILNGVALKSYLEFVDFTISGRMHFGISGYSLCKPMIGISYEEKFSGLQKHFEIDPKFSLVDYTELENLSSIIIDFMLKLQLYKQNSEKNIKKVKSMSNLNFENE